MNIEVRVLKPVRNLECSCCGQSTIGRQWWNRDNGYGLCESCAIRIEPRESEEDMKSCYGIKGFHYCLINENVEESEDD